MYVCRRHGHNDIKKSSVLSLCPYACVYVASTMSLCCVIHTGDIKHQYEVFLNLRDLAVMSLCC